MKIKHLLLVSFVILIIGLTAVSATDSDDTATTDNSGSDVAVDSSSSTAQATDSSTHTDSSVDKTSDASTTSSSSQKTDVTSQQTTQKVSEKTSEKTQTTSDITAKTSSDTNSQSTQSTSQSTSQSQSNSNITNENTNSVKESVVDSSKIISMDDDVSSESDEHTPVVYNITSSNVGDLTNIMSQCRDGDTVNFEGNFYGLYMVVNYNITITSFSSANLTSTFITINNGADGTTVSNLNINNSGRTHIFNIEKGVSDLSINNNTLYVFSASSNATGITLNNNNNTHIENNNIIVYGVTKDIDWSTGEGIPNSYAIGVFSSSNVYIRYNNIECYSITSSGYASTNIGVSVQGSNQKSEKVSNVYVTNNNITVQDNMYAYGVYFQYDVDSSFVNYNNITSINEGGSYAAGYNEFGTGGISIMGNNITLDVKETAYGIVLTGDSEAYSSNKVIMSNTINVTSNRTRGIELYYVNHSLVQSNSIFVNGNYTEGICGGSAQYCNITKNRIMVNGVKTDSIKDADEIPLVNAGISLTQVAYENVTNEHSSYVNNITGNYIYSYGNSTIYLSASYNDVVNNQLTLDRGSYILYGDETVYNNGTNNTIANNTGYILSGSQLDDQTLAVTHVVTQDNYAEYFEQATDTSEAGLSNLVNDGDILDFQGTINITNQSFVINKAVNVTSTTGDSLICLNTQAGDYFGDDPGASFIIDKGGSYSNITNIYLFNTELWVVNASYVVFDNISAVVIDARVGSGVGQTSIRPGSSYITIKNSYFHTENNGGSSTFVVAGGGHCVLENNTIEGAGTCGNLVYITSYNTDVSEEEANSYIDIINNRIVCNETPTDIRWGLVIASGSNYNIINNTIDYTGIGITGQWGTDNVDSNVTIVNNTLDKCSRSNLPANSTVYGNKFSDVYILGDTIFYNNTANEIHIIGNDSIVLNNTISSDLTTNTSNNRIENNIFSGENTTIQLSGSNLIVNNNTFTGNQSTIYVNGSNNILENNTLHKITNDPSLFSYQGIIVINDTCENNTVRYNDLIYYDLFRESFTVGDDCVHVEGVSTGNIIQDNYGNISEVEIPTNDTNYTYISYNVTSMEELINAINDIKTNGTYSEDTKYVINLLEGDYTVTEAITWDSATSNVREVIINGTGQTINGNEFTSTFLTIGNGYSLTLTNLTMTNFTLSKSINSIMNKGNLTIENCTLDNAGQIGGDYNIGMLMDEDVITASIIINNTKITETTIVGVLSEIKITNSEFYDTNETEYAIITNKGGNLTFFNNKVSNITSNYFINSDYMSVMTDDMYAYNAAFFIENNEFTDLHSIVNDILLNPSGNTGGFTYTLINNTFTNGVNIGVNRGSRYTLYTMENTYINCSLPVNITNIQNTTITTEDYSTTVTVTANSTYGAIVDGQIIVSIDGKEYKTFDVENGEAKITIENSALNLADNNIEVKYVSPNNGFENASTTFTITLAEDMIIRIPEGTLYSGDTIALTTQVAVNGSIAKDGYVIFKVNGKTVRDENGNPIMIQVDENGMASLNYTIPDINSNEYNITAVYSGSEGIVRTNTTLTTTLKTATITVEPITAKAGQTVTLRAYITDQNGNPVNTGKLIFKLNGKTLKDSEGNTLYATIVNGVATLNYTIPDNYSAKEYTLTAVYQGTGFERSESNSTLTLTKSTPTIIPDSTVFGTNNTITINQGTESVNIKATIYDPETNAPINTTTVVTIKINDKTVTQQYVSNGQIDMTIYTSSFNNPEYNITVVVGENSQYARTSFNGTLIVNPMNSLANETSYNGTLLVKED